MKKILIILVFTIGLFSGCTKDNGNAGIAYTPTCSGTAKSYKTDVAPLIQSYCAGCHSNYSTYAQLSASKSTIRSVIVSGSMPRNSSLSSTQKDAIVCWIDNGAANN
jgi:hypothetical protein